jgi:cytoskeletal protein RodZ
MARKVAPGTLIHCDACGEDYSATYKRCPFCGEKPGKGSTAPIPPLEEEDDYVFEGGDVFDDEDESQDARPKGGKRLAQEDEPGTINWPRLITFICSLVIIAAALVIVFAYIYPKIHKTASDPDSAASSVVSQEPTVSDSVDAESPAVTNDPSGETTDDPNSTVTEEPDSTATVEPSAQPSQEPAASAGVSGVTGLSLSKTDVTLKSGESFTLKATVAPSSWSGTVTWSSSNENVATVSASGVVTNTNTGSDVRSATITATADGKTATCIIRCHGGSSADPTASSQPSTSSEPTSSSSGGTLSLNRTDFTITLGDTFTMKATGADSVTWSIGNTGVATISESGVVTPVAAGQTTITATAADGQTATCIVRVKN